MNSNRLELTKKDLYYTHDPGDAIHIISGSIYLYIVPWSEQTGKPGRRVPLCEVEEGRTLPSFAWRDENYQQWRFLLMSKSETTEMEILPGAATLILKKRFLHSAGIETFDQEGYEGSLAEYYKNNELKDDVFLEREKRKVPEEQSRTFSAMASVLGGQTIATGDQSDQLYSILAFAARKLSTELVSRAKIEAEVSEMSLPEMCRVSDIICRDVVLDVDWFKHDCGVIAAISGDHPVICYPAGGKYKVYDQSTGQDTDLTKAMLGTLNPKAWSLRRTLPKHALNKKDILAFVRKSFKARDVVWLIVLGLLSTLIGVLQPKLNQLIYDDYIPMGETNVLIQVCAVIGTFMIGNVFISIVKQLQEYRIPCKVDYELQDAVYWRLFQLPESFFRKYDSADLAQRVMGIGEIANSVAKLIVSNGLALVLSLIYLIQMFKYSWKLALVGILMISVWGAAMYFISKKTLKNEEKSHEYNGQAAGKLYQFIGGVDKIRMAGANERAILEYTLPVVNEKKENIRANRLTGLVSILSESGQTIFSMVLYYMVIKSKLDLSTGAFMAFNTAFGSFCGAVIGFIGAGNQYQHLKPAMKRAAPVFESAAEDEENKDSVEYLKGDISLEHVSFGYTADQMVLKDLNIHVHPGEYVALVGPSGCGKSTTLKLLLGFEKPMSGRVLYDNKDLNGIDKHSLRKRVGVVLQNGKLISGSIYDNITITARNPKMEDVRAVIEDVGLKDDIDAMPMGIHTVVSESGGTISGGQQQRILIARAIMSNPSILFFDEATSALDNITQAKVCESLEKRNMTRIVIAHRLSTVQHCDRIFVLDRGTVVEEGNFETLMARRGMFYQMAIRQIAE